MHPAAAPAAWHYFDRGTDTDVIMIGRGPGRRVAVLFFHRDFPKARFGHRFFLEPCAEDYEKIWLKEDIDTGALHRMMRNQPTADSAGIIWTTWGNPDPGQEGEPRANPSHRAQPGHCLPRRHTESGNLAAMITAECPPGVAPNPKRHVHAGRSRGNWP